MKAMARISARSLPLIGLHVIATISLETLIREMITRLEGDTSSGRPDHPVAGYTSCLEASVVDKVDELNLGMRS
jgi:hypothetical protein